MLRWSFSFGLGRGIQPNIVIRLRGKAYFGSSGQKQENPGSRQELNEIEYSNSSQDLPIPIANSRITDSIN